MNNKTGCLMWAVLFCFVLLWGWKLMDFFILEPAGVKKDINEIVDQVGRIQNTQAKQVEFLSRWGSTGDPPTDPSTRRVSAEIHS